MLNYDTWTFHIHQLLTKISEYKETFMIETYDRQDCPPARPSAIKSSDECSHPLKMYCLRAYYWGGHITEDRKEFCERKLFQTYFKIHKITNSHFLCFVFRYVFLETFHIFWQSIPRNIEEEIFFIQICKGNILNGWISMNTSLHTWSNAGKG